MSFFVLGWIYLGLVSSQSRSSNEQKNSVASQPIKLHSETVSSGSCSSNVLNSVAFVIMSQPFKLHSEIAKETETKLENMLKKDGVENPFVLTLHKDLGKVGAWTIFPILPDLEKIPKVFKRIGWFAFLPGS